MEQQKLTAFINDSSELAINLEWAGTPFEPADEWALIFTAKDSDDDLDSSAVFQKASGAGIAVSGSVATVELVPSDTELLTDGRRLFDVQAQNILSGKVRTVAFGEVYVMRDITRLTETSVPVSTTEGALPFARTATEIHAATTKATPVDVDEFGFWDSVSGLIRKASWANIKATLKTHFDGIYQAIGSYATAAQGALADTALQEVTPAAVLSATEAMDAEQQAGMREAIGANASVLKLLAVGDSITSRTTYLNTEYGLNYYSYSGWPAALIGLTGGKIELVPRNNAYAVDYTHAYPGIRADRYISGTDAWLNGVIPIDDAVAAAADADVIVVHIGTNDIPGDSASVVAARVRAIWQALAATGKKVVGTDILHRTAAASGWSSTLRDRVNDTNKILRASWQADGLWSYRNWVDLMTLDANGYADTNELRADDGLHPTMRLGMKLGNDIFGLLSPYIVGNGMTIPQRGSARWLTPNPYVSGDSAGFATSWGNNVLPNSTATKIIDEDGTEWQRMASTDTLSFSPNYSFRSRITTGIPAAGTRVRACARIRTRHGVSLNGVWLGCQQVGSPKTSDWWYPMDMGGATTTTASSIGANEFLVISEPFLLDASVTQLWVAVGMTTYGAADIDFRQAGIFLDPL